VNGWLELRWALANLQPEGPHRQPPKVRYLR
jgi:hypothetical protein